MSVYVDILPDCCDCCVCNDDYWRCGINCEDISHDGRREDCPLIEIVHCKDCKWFDSKRANFIDGYGYCERYEVTDKDSHYCSYGEKQVTGKLNNPDDSLLTEDSEACKEQESKLYIPLNQHTVERINRLHKNDCGDCFDEEWLYNELEQIAERHHTETSTTSKTETVDTPTNTPTDLISRQAAIELACWRCKKCERKDCEYTDSCKTMKLLDALPSEDPKPPVEDMGEVSDGYHTFNQLYHQRAVLFATIVNQNKDNAWKSWKHEDGKFCFDKEGEWFIVGVDTPEGSYTYHYEKKYWDLFDCKELDRGKHWDGHTEDDVTRLLSLPPVEPKTDLVNRSDVLELAKSGLLISNGNYKKVCEAINGLPSCHTCREGEPVEIKPVADAISRADALKAICAECDVKCEDGTDKEAHCTEYAVINDMPPVDPKQPKGKWIVYPLIDDGRVELECPECGETFIQAIDYRPHFCENCGADMRGDSE